MTDAVSYSGYMVQAWFGSELADTIPDDWRWWMNTHGLDKAVTEQQRLEYYHGVPARTVPRGYWRGAPVEDPTWADWLMRKARS